MCRRGSAIPSWESSLCLRLSRGRLERETVQFHRRLRVARAPQGLGDRPCERGVAWIIAEVRARVRDGVRRASLPQAQGNERAAWERRRRRGLDEKLGPTLLVERHTLDPGDAEEARAYPDDDRLARIDVARPHAVLAGDQRDPLQRSVRRAQVDP